jgi:hypothetical protein
MPFAAIIALLSLHGAAVFVAVMIFHHWAWNKMVFPFGDHVLGTAVRANAADLTRACARVPFSI